MVRVEEAESDVRRVAQLVLKLRPERLSPGPPGHRGREFESHRFYLREGIRLAGHHFSVVKGVDEWT